MKVRDIMDTDVITLRRDATYEDAVKTFHDSEITGCPIVDDQGKLVGIVSYKDLLRILFPYYDSYYKNPESYTDSNDRESKAQEIRNHKIETFMTAPVHTTTPDMPILQAAGIMLAHHIQRLPVLEGERIVGIVTRTKILRALFQKNFQLS